MRSNGHHKQPGPPVAERDDRLTDRVAVDGHLVGQMMAPLSMVLCDVGPRGLQVEVGCRLRLYALYELRLSLGADTVVARARVAHCGICRIERGEITYRAGLELVAPGEHVALVIADFVQVVRSRAHDRAAYPTGDLTPVDGPDA
jgi:hypothetical protein